MMQSHRIRQQQIVQLRRLNRRNRRGVSAVDYILVLGIILPLVAIVVPQGMRIIRGVYEMILVLIAWPFL